MIFRSKDNVAIYGKIDRKLEFFINVEEKIFYIFKEEVFLFRKNVQRTCKVVLCFHYWHFSCTELNRVAFLVLGIETIGLGLKSKMWVKLRAKLGASGLKAFFSLQIYQHTSNFHFKIISTNKNILICEIAREQIITGLKLENWIVVLLQLKSWNILEEAEYLQFS